MSHARVAHRLPHSKRGPLQQRLYLFIRRGRKHRSQQVRIFMSEQAFKTAIIIFSKQSVPLRNR